MKKAIKIIGIILAVSLVIAFAVIYVLFPTETKDTLNLIKEHINQPLPIVGVSILTIGGVVWFILSKTTFGKKVLRDIKNDVAEVKNEVKLKEDLAKKYESEAKDHEEATNKALGDQNAKIGKIIKELSKLCKTSPNAKIKALSTEFENIIKENASGNDGEAKRKENENQENMGLGSNG